MRIPSVDVEAGITAEGSDPLARHGAPSGDSSLLFKPDMEAAQRLLETGFMKAGRSTCTLHDYDHAKSIHGENIAHEEIHRMPPANDDLRKIVAGYCAMGDHGLLNEGCWFYESLVYLPLIVSLPAQFVRWVFDRSYRHRRSTRISQPWCGPKATADRISQTGISASFRNASL
jgi:hypothetical protein